MDSLTRDDWNLLFSALGALFSILTLIVSILIYKLSRSRKLRISSSATVVNDEPVAIIRVTNFGQAQSVVENVGLSLTKWDDRPKLRVRGFMRFLRVLEFLGDHVAEIKYISDKAIIDSRPPLHATLSEHQSITVTISLDRMMEACFDRREIIGSKSSFAFLMMVLRCEVVTPIGTFGVFAHREIRWYLWQRYKDDKRLLMR